MNQLPRPLQMVLWLALLGAVVYFGTRVAGKAASRVGA